MSDSDKAAVAALISVILRRKANRVIDIKWLVKNQEYAREIILLSRQQNQHDLNEYANRLEKLMFSASSAIPATSTPHDVADDTEKLPAQRWDATESEDAAEANTSLASSKYVGSLR